MKASQRAACIIIGCSLASWLRNRQSSTEVLTRVVGSSRSAGMMASAAVRPSRQSLRLATSMRTQLRFQKSKTPQLQRLQTVPLLGGFAANTGSQHAGYIRSRHSVLPFFTVAAFLAEFSGPGPTWMQDCTGGDTAISIPVAVASGTADLEFTSSKGTSSRPMTDNSSPSDKEVPIERVNDGGDLEPVSAAAPEAAAATGEDSPSDVVRVPRPQQLVSESGGHRIFGVQCPRPGSHKAPANARPTKVTTGYWPAAHHTPVAVWQGPKKNGGKEATNAPAFPPPCPIPKLEGSTAARRNVGGLIATRMAVYEHYPGSTISAGWEN